MKGNTHKEKKWKKRRDDKGGYYWEEVEVDVVDNYPGDPEPPSMGVHGCVVVYYDK